MAAPRAATRLPHANSRIENAGWGVMVVQPITLANREFTSRLTYFCTSQHPPLELGLAPGTTYGSTLSRGSMHTVERAWTTTIAVWRIEKPENTSAAKGLASHARVKALGAKRLFALDGLTSRQTDEPYARLVATNPFVQMIITDNKFPLRMHSSYARGT